MKKIPRADPVIWACITLDHDWAKIAHLVQTRIFQEVSHIDFYVIIVLYHAAKSEKKNPKSGFWDICLCNLWPQFGQNCPYSSKEVFWGKFHEIEFYRLIVPLRLNPEIWACIILDDNQDKIAHLDQVRFFWGISLEWYVFAYRPCHTAKFKKIRWAYYPEKLHKIGKSTDSPTPTPHPHPNTHTPTAKVLRLKIIVMEHVNILAEI